MPITQNILRRAVQRSPLRKSFSPLPGQKTAFLCHSHVDRDLAEGLQQLLKEEGWSLYIDWQDHSMPPVPDRETARKIQLRISASDWFLYLATENSAGSRWCPWEIGIADGKKDPSRIVVIPTEDDRGRHYGNEYLQLYRHLDPTSLGRLQFFEAGSRQGRGLSFL
ncbi:toll/interleukin-1 receptor domain-containing protein [Paraburkholderia bengalensis]|uniref:Toll/interleukin-1 receptor domain-containing protein n=1 Tax=Paraburkholderia bengalensis TaxID=2747562 RepID=A0ABU8IRD3_9BURK